MITEDQYKEIAEDLGIEVAVIKAVQEVESNGSGFLDTGEPKILFEPHIFWRELYKKDINPNRYKIAYKTVLYEKWGTLPYGKESEQHKKLQLAANIDREAALMSASWGQFQLMGFNWKLCGFDSLQEFINAMYTSEYTQLLAFVEFIKNKGLVKHLKTKDWRKFARGYNGVKYASHGYHTRLEKAYNKWKQ